MYDISTALLADAHDLMVGLTDQPADLIGAASALRRDLHLAVRSSLGFSISLRYDATLTITVVDRPLTHTDVGSSLRLDQAAPPRGVATSTSYYASRPGAFVDLAADLTYALDLPLHAAILDERLPDKVLTTAITGVSDLSDINTALGYLIGHGRTLPQARNLLTTQAATTGTDLAAAARTLLGGSEPHRTP